MKKIVFTLSPNISASYLGSSVGTVNISEIDYSNLEISGRFNLIGSNKPNINCIFFDVPFTLNSL